MDEVSLITALIYCFGRVFQAVAQGGGTQAETGRLPELKRQSSEPRETKVRKNSRDLQRFCLKYLVLLATCVLGGDLRPEKEPLKTNRGNNTHAHTGLGIVPAPTSQTGKPVKSRILLYW